MTKQFTKGEYSYLWGCQITPYLFPFKTNTLPNLVERMLPMLPDSEVNYVEVIVTENEEDKRKKNFRHGCIVAQPDVVFLNRNAYIVLEFKSLANSNQKHELSKWEKQIRLKDVLQAIIAALQVSVVKNAPAVCVLRYINSCYIINPCARLCSYILEKAPKVRDFKSEPGDKYVSASVLAETLEPDIRKMFSTNTDDDEKGKEIHNKMLSQ